MYYSKLEEGLNVLDNIDFILIYLHAWKDNDVNFCTIKITIFKHTNLFSF